MKPLPITEYDLRLNATEKVYARGEDYFHDGMVLEVVRRGRTRTADVQGREDEPYQVSVLFGKGGVREADCTCPYSEEWEGWCKHTVAALLFYLDVPGDVETRPPLKTVLSGLSRGDLQKLVLALAQHHPQLLTDIEDEAARLAAP